MNSSTHHTRYFWRHTANALAILLAGPAVIGTLAGFLGRIAWFLDAATHFQVQYAIVLGLIGGFEVGRKRRSWPGWVCLGVAALNGALLLPFYLTPSPPSPTATPALRVLVVNVQEQTPAFSHLQALIARQQPDLILATETPAAWVEYATNAIQDTYPYGYAIPRYSGHGITLFSRLPLQDAYTWDILPVERPVLVAHLAYQGTPLTIIGLHPHPPLDQQQWQWRNDLLAVVAGFAAQQSGAVLVLGDLNATPWSPLYQDFLAQAQLQDGRLGFGIYPTWPVATSLIRMPLDHILPSSHLTVTNLYRETAVGSDHFPLLADLTLTPAR